MNHNDVHVESPWTISDRTSLLISEFNSLNEDSTLKHVKVINLSKERVGLIANDNGKVLVRKTNSIS